MKIFSCLMPALLIGMWACQPESHDLRLAPLFGDHMVLQQQSQVPVWGWARPRQKVSVSGSWDGNTATTQADGQGRWELELVTPAAGGPFELTVSSGAETLKLEDVLLGEVWLAGGQSNMEWSLSQSDSAEAAVAAAHRPQIRFFHVAHALATAPLDSCVGNWQVCEPEAAADFSAVAYYFGRRLQQELGVPVGLIGSYWGGTPAQAWIPREGFASHPDLRLLIRSFEADLNAYLGDTLNEPNPLSPSSPTVLYNGMIAPLAPYKIQGAIWYQGEANVGDPYLYRTLFPTLIRSWRETWGADFPFYYVQIAPFHYPIPYSAGGLRESQLMALSLPRTGMAVTLDTGDPSDQHPRDKRTVGERLARWALAGPYGQKLVPSGPLYERMEVEGDRIRLFFTYSAGKLSSRGGPLTHFRIAGADRVFYDARAEIANDTTVVVSAPQVGTPRAVRFAFANDAQPNLYNQEGLPASSFRTDDWPMIFILPRILAGYDRENDLFDVVIAREAPAIQIRYTLDGSEPGPQSKLYNGPFRTQAAATIKARAFQEGFPAEGMAVKQLIRHQGMRGQASLKRNPNPKYPGGGAQGLIDGLTGSTDFLDPAWLGYDGEDFEATLDLGEMKRISAVQARFLQNQGAWIFLPEDIRIEVSKDGQVFEPVYAQQIDAAQPHNEVEIRSFGTSLQQQTRFIRVRATGVKQCPEWHPGAGGKTWIFVDEMVVN